MYSVIIPSAKVVSQEMQHIGKLPAIIYPVNKGIVMDYLLDLYNDNEEFNIVLYEEKDKVYNYFKKYENRSINLINIDDIKDLGYTILCGIEKMKASSECIINFADTITFDKIQDYDEDCFFYTEEYPSERWSYFEENDGIITNVIDKKKSYYDGKKELCKIFTGVFKINNIVDFKEILNHEVNAKNNGIDSFYRALMKYSKKYRMKSIKSDEWFDIGHADRYCKSKLGVSAREFNQITVDKERGILKKISREKEKFIGEISWYLKIPTDIEYVRPRIFSYSTNYDNPYVEMEYYAYHTVHELFLYADLTYNQWKDIFNRIKFIYNDFSRYKVEDSSIKDSLEEMYLNKTIERLDKLKNDKRFTPFFESEFEINGIMYKSLNDILEIIKKIVPKQLYDIDKFNIIHGDLCFANIMIDSNRTFIKVIDPRGKFGKYDIYGDQRYELAKLFHSVDGKYDFIIKDLFSINININREIPTIDYRLIDRERSFNLFECFIECFKNQIGNDMKKIELIESLLFLSMIPLHNEDINHQYAMLATGIQILDRCTNIQIDKIDCNENLSCVI